MAKKKNEISINTLVSELLRSMNEWHRYNIHGGSDPNWHDGSNMNLIRNHIIYNKNKLEEFCTTNNLDLPNEYFFPTPEVVDKEYMAKRDEIIKKSNELYEIACKSEEYNFLKENFQLINDKKLRETAHRIVSWLEPNKDDIVRLRVYTYHFDYFMSRVTEIVEQNRESMLLLSNIHSMDQSDNVDFIEEYDEDYEDDFEDDYDDEYEE